MTFASSHVKFSIALNQIGVVLLEKHSYAQAHRTLSDALIGIRVACAKLGRAQLTESEQDFDMDAKLAKASMCMAKPEPSTEPLSLSMKPGHVNAFPVRIESTIEDYEDLQLASGIMVLNLGLASIGFAQDLAAQGQQAKADELTQRGLKLFRAATGIFCSLSSSTDDSTLLAGPELIAYSMCSVSAAILVLTRSNGNRRELRRYRAHLDGLREAAKELGRCEVLQHTQRAAPAA